MHEAEFFNLVKSELNSIKVKRGILPPTPYLVCEIGERLQTVKNWEEKNKDKPVLLYIREIVEHLLFGKVFVINTGSAPVKTTAVNKKKPTRKRSACLECDEEY